MTGTWSDSVPRKAAALLVALVALSVALLRPACDVFASQARGTTASAVTAQLGSAAGHALHHGGAASGDCCASIGEGQTAAAADWPLAPERGAMLALAPVAPLYPVATTFLLRLVRASAPPPTASFYIRSARVQR